TTDGVPLTLPEGLRLTPVGQLPLTKANVYGAVPPLAVRPTEYAECSTATFKVGGEIVSVAAADAGTADVIPMPMPTAVASANRRFTVRPPRVRAIPILPRPRIRCTITRQDLLRKIRSGPR